jgi:hypothetical protein
VANKNGSFFFRKNGIFYFIRRVPVQLQRHYITARISFSLKTRSKKVALVRSKALAARLDDYWFRLQMLEDETLGKYLNHKSPKTSIIDAVRDNGDEKNLLADTLSRVCNLQQPTMQHGQWIALSV